MESKKKKEHKDREKKIEKEKWRDRLSCQAAVNLHDRDVETADFFCTSSTLICTHLTTQIGLSKANLGVIN